MGGFSLKIGENRNMLKKKQEKIGTGHPALLWCSSRFLRALQQNRAQARLLCLLNGEI